MTVTGALSRFRRRAPSGREEAACELCSAPIELEHAHLVDLEMRAMRCACRACAVLFRQPGAGARRWRTVPDRVLFDPAATVAERDWAALDLPVGLAFLFLSSAAGRWVAIYPGPAGVVESSLPLEGWVRLAERLPLAAAAAPDVEALLVRGERGTGRVEVLLVPIDRCYALAGRLRRVWRGLDGGAEARRELDTFFAELRARARPLVRATGGCP